MTVRLPVNLYSTVQLESARTNRSQTGIVVEAIERYLFGERSKPADTEYRRELMSSVIFCREVVAKMSSLDRDDIQKLNEKIDVYVERMLSEEEGGSFG